MKLNSSIFCNRNIIFVEQRFLGCKIIPIPKWEQLADLLFQINLGQDSNLRWYFFVQCTAVVKAVLWFRCATTNKKEQMPPQRFIINVSPISPKLVLT